MTELHIDDDPANLDLNVSITCKYCDQVEDKQSHPGLVCETCDCFVHLSCLRRPGTPGDFACDVFFDFTCEECSDDGKEVFVRNRFTWVNVILLTLHHLSTQSYGISNNGFFHYKTHICSFIDRSWSLLFGHQTKQKKNWVGTIAGSLSVYNSLVFQSGSLVLGETGWWKLMHGFSPALAAHIIQELGKEKSKGKPWNHLTLDKTVFITKVSKLGYEHLLTNEEDEEPVFKKKRTEDLYSSTFMNQFESDSRSDFYDYNYDALPSTADADLFKGFVFPPSNSVDTPALSSTYQNDISIQQITYYDSDSSSNAHNQQTELPPVVKQKKAVVEDKPIVILKSSFSNGLNSLDMPWREKTPQKDDDLVEMTQYQEVQLLKQVESMISKMKDPPKKAELHRLRAKLALRRLKRHKQLPLFDLDRTVKLLGGYMTEDSRTVSHVERVLDRFQRSYLLDSLCGTIASASCSTLLVPRIEPVAFRSAHSGTLLKPYIRRDTSAAPLWLRLQEELLTRTNRHVPGYRTPARAPLDYSYLRPQHLPAVNNLCAQFFWPGIDLTEALQYPEFSCVVTYKKLVVACAFLVPDAGRREAYISFVLTRPEWRNAKIASFMLYHLLQTCSGKDVTLHVSPTNPAIFLYQKFGFKVEELIQDFYEKYYDIEYKGCRHALFLRLIR